MKKTALVLLLGILLLLAGCSKKSTTPEEKPAEDYTLEASQTIGSGGGTLEVEDFKLMVPQDAFSSDAELKLYASSHDKPFGDNCASRTFRLDGLPDEYSQPLQLSIKYQGTLSDSSFIAVGEEAMVAGSGESETGYQMLSATDSAGYLHCQLPASDGDTLFPKRDYHQTISGSDKGRKLLVTSKFLANRYMYTPLAKHYTIYVPSGVAVNVTDLADLLDTAYVTFDRWGYFFVNIADVIVRDLDTDDYCKFKYRNRDHYGYIEVNAKKMTQSHFPKLQVMIGREVYRWILFSGLYDPYYPVMAGPSQQDYYWLNEAAVSWCEEWFVPPEQRSNYVPADFTGNEMVPFNSMQAGQGDVVTKARKHGCGMSAMMKYLDEEFGVAGDPAVTILSYIHTELGVISKKHPVEAIIAGIGSPEGLPKDWWWDFLKKYVQGDIYNVSGNVFTQEKNISGVFDIKSDNDTLAKFPGSYPDLSAKLYRINLEHKTIDENAEIELKAASSEVAAEEVRLVLFKFDGSKLSFLKYGHLRVLIENARQLTDEGVDLIAMIVNSSYHPPDYTANSAIDLEVRVITEELWECQIWFELEGYFRIIWGDGSPDTYGWRTWWPNWDRVRGSFSGNNFDVDWDTTDVMGDPYSGFMRITFNPTRDTVKSVVASAEYIREYCPAELSLNAWDIPLHSGSVSHPYYRVGGEEACDHIGQILYRWQKGSTIDTLLYYECNAESYMSISFDKIE